MHDKPELTGGLTWPVKASFMAYLSQMGAKCHVTDGAMTTEERAFHFPADSPATEQSASGDALGETRYRGCVVFQAHHGMLDIRIGEPGLRHDGRSGEITIVDPDCPDLRMVLATFDVVFPTRPGRPGEWNGTRVRLSADAVDMFFGAYNAGELFDDFVVRPACAPPTGHGNGD
jgi:hypothetical protein